ncbi:MULTISPECIES: TetR/AcrR family transcriptional regulator [Variovorax]|jgi:TetR/AcrR family transcriptional regulator|uniref:TetR/AcrR family transcriptional regulator n=1 Tax=Variovorax TaxID=34072 RepID=UPI0008E9D938|nr:MULTISPECIES: TetR/AcrR family transcriptional regulator [unclassified Variovorax]QRF56413.1 TetR family transcriptional regulator [Variovorax paradoxus]TAJ59958.1 MAG: TetR/AcrR family transcriptional regulator [Variovorax sp.]SFO09409.1 transcriptional regulator, TetR family [Variovorax sp. PDC80]
MTHDTKTPKPRQRNAVATRDRILKIASKEFAAHGYDGARIDAIVARCKISKNLVYHYFDSKEALFIEVMERAYGAMRERQNELALTGEDPVRDMRELVEKTVQHFIDQPEFHQLLSTENLHKAVHIRKSKVISEMFNPLRTALSTILESGKQKGVFRRDADWVDLYVSISGLGSYFITNRYTLSYVLDVDLGASDRQQSRLRHASDMVISYLCDRSGDAA